MITYTTELEGIGPQHLGGFFPEWPNPPSPEALHRILKGSAHAVLALDSEAPEEQRVIGLITAISDGVSSAYIPHLEVRRDYRGQGIGSALVRRMLDRLRHLYMIDLTCDPDMQPFYARLGLRPANAMLVRNYERQDCS